MYVYMHTRGGTRLSVDWTRTKTAMAISFGRVLLEQRSLPPSPGIHQTIQYYSMIWKGSSNVRIFSLWINLIQWPFQKTAAWEQLGFAMESGPSWSFSGPSNIGGVAKNMDEVRLINETWGALSRGQPWHGMVERPTYLEVSSVSSWSFLMGSLVFARDVLLFT